MSLTLLATLLFSSFSGASAGSVRIVSPITIPEGATLDDVATRLETLGLAKASDVLALSRSEEFAHSLGMLAPDLEGYLKPGEHIVFAYQPAQAILRTLIRPLPAELRAKAKTLGLDMHQALTLASLVEEGAPGYDHYELAGILWNRLRRGFHLNSPASVAYAKRLLGRPLVAERLDHQLEHPYNTFLHRGLPPGPINSPSEEALEAALNPAKTNRLVAFQSAAPSPEERVELAAVRPDPPPEKTIRDLHYYISNERQQYLFRPAIDRLGGVWLGVGTDQNYLMAGWLRPELLILMDFDQVVVNLHTLYRLAFLASETPDDFRALWSRPDRRRFVELVRAGPRRNRSALLEVLRTARSTVSARFERVQEAYGLRGESTFLTDPEQYAHIRALFQDDRVVAIRGNLTGRFTLQDLARVLSRRGRIVRGLYLSNAEQYFTYGNTFKANVRALPTDEWSVVLRTFPTNDDYTYMLQRHRGFLRWLENAAVKSVRQMLPPGVRKLEVPLVQVVGEPPHWPARRPQKVQKDLLGGGI